MVTEGHKRTAIGNKTYLRGRVRDNTTATIALDNTRDLSEPTFEEESHAVDPRRDGNVRLRIVTTRSANRRT